MSIAALGFSGNGTGLLVTFGFGGSSAPGPTTVLGSPGRLMLLRQSTAASVLVGPVLDSSGSAVTGAVVGDFNLTKNGTTAALASPATVTHSHNGHYLVALATGNVDTIGQAVITVNNTSYAMRPAVYVVLAGPSYDELVTGLLSSPRALGTVPDSQMAVSDARWSAVIDPAGRRFKSGTTLTYRTPSTNTVVRTFTLDTANPSNRT